MKSLSTNNHWYAALGFVMVFVLVTIPAALHFRGRVLRRPRAEAQTTGPEDSTMNMDQQLEAGLNELSGLIDVATVRDAHLLADSYTLGFSRLALSNGRATQQLVASTEPQTAFATARAAFEAGQDAAYMACSQSEYDIRAALAYTLELVECEDLRRRWFEAGTDYGYPTDDKGMTVEEVVNSDAIVLEADHPERASELRDALVEAREKDRFKRHWSGTGRNALNRLLAECDKRLAGMAQVGDAFYGYLSVQSHPRLRHWYDKLSLTSDNKIVVQSNEASHDLPLGMALVATELARYAIRRAGLSSTIA